MLSGVTTRPIAFISDYGHRDPFAGICRAVIAGVSPRISVTDITHGIPAHDVHAGAVAAADATPYLPDRAVLMAIVDPGVGGDRRAIAALTADDVALVGPDNGLLWLAAQRLGGVTELADIGQTEARLRPTSSTFHGRDIFAPVAARIACGDELASLGKALPAGQMTPLLLPAATLGEARIDAAVLDIDSFGNVRLCADAALLAQIGAPEETALEVECDGVRLPATSGLTFTDVPAGELVVYTDATGALAIAANGASAQKLLRAERASKIAVMRP
jgi:S-adenosylmethionine hydrolase